MNMKLLYIFRGAYCNLDMPRNKSSYSAYSSGVVKCSGVAGGGHGGTQRNLTNALGLTDVNRAIFEADNCIEKHQKMYL